MHHGFILSHHAEWVKGAAEERATIRVGQAAAFHFDKALSRKRPPFSAHISPALFTKYEFNEGIIVRQLLRRAPAALLDLLFKLILHILGGSRVNRLAESLLADQPCPVARDG